MEGDDKMKAEHWNLLLPLFFDPSESDSMSVVDQSVDTHGIVAVSAVTSHVQNMSVYSLSNVKHYDLRFHYKLDSE